MTKTLEEWSTTLRPVPTMVQGLEDIARDFRMKLPDRSSLFLFNSIPVQVFREMGALDAVAKKQQEHRILHEEVLEQAREQGGNVPDISHVAAEVTRQAGMADVLRQQMEGLAASARQEEEGRRAEALQEAEKFAAARRAEEEKQRIAREISQVHVDGMAADIDRMREASAAAGVTNNTVTHQYDQRVTHNTHVEQNTHAMMLNFLAHHQTQLAAFAVQQGITNERAMAILAENLKREQARPNQVVQILQQTLVNPNFEPRDPKPPPGYGAARAPAKQRDSTYPFPFSTPMMPTAVPVAALQPATQALAEMVPETPVPKVPRSRSRGPRKPKDEEGEVVPVIRKPRSRTPAKPTPPLDTPMPSALKRTASETERVPVAFDKPSKKKRPVSTGEVVPVIRAKAMPRKPAAVIEPETPQAPRRKSRARSATETEVVPVAMNRSGRSRSRPPRVAPETPVPMDIARAAAALGEDADVDVIPQMTKKAPRAPNKKPTAKAVRGKVVLDREAIRAQIRRVSVSVAPVTRGRGRPPGSLNKATLARLQPAV